MGPRWLMALLVLLREAWSARRDAHIRFLKLQVQMLRSRLPGTGLWTTETLSQARYFLSATSVGELAFFAGGAPTPDPPTGYSDILDIYVIPEPLTVLGVLLGVGGLARYLRRRELG